MLKLNAMLNDILYYLIILVISFSIIQRFLIHKLEIFYNKHSQYLHVILNEVIQESWQKILFRSVMGLSIGLVVFNLIINFLSLSLNMQENFMAFISKILLYITALLLFSFILLLIKIVLLRNIKSLILLTSKYFKKNRFNDNSKYFSHFTEIWEYCIIHSKKNTTNLIMNFYDIKNIDNSKVEWLGKDNYNSAYYTSIYKILNCYFSKGPEYLQIANKLYSISIYGSDSIHSSYSKLIFWSIIENNAKFENDNYLLKYWKILNDQYQEKYKDEKGRDYLGFIFSFTGIAFENNRINLLKEILDLANNNILKYIVFPESIEELYKWYIAIDYQISADIRYKRERDDSILRIHSYGTDRPLKLFFSVLFLRLYDSYRIDNKADIFKFNFRYSNMINNVELKESLIDFKQHIIEIMNNNSLLDQFGIWSSNINWIAVEKKPNPIDMINSHIDSIIDSYEIIEINRVIPTKVTNGYYQYIKDKMMSKIEPFISLFNNPIVENYNSWVANGFWDLYWKYELPEPKFINFDDVFHQPMVNFYDWSDLNKIISKAFYFSKTRSYRMSFNHACEAIEKKLENKHLYKVLYFVPHSKEWYKREFKSHVFPRIENIDISIMYTSRFKLIFESLVVIKKEYLPYLFSKPLPKPFIMEQKDVEQICPSLNLYAALIDLNKEQKLIKQIPIPDKFEYLDFEGLRQCAYTEVLFDLELRFSKDAKFTIFSDLDDSINVYTNWWNVNFD